MKNIAVLVAGLTISTITEVTDGIRDCIAANNCNAFFFTCERRYEKSIPHDVGEYNIFNLPDFKEFDGVILINSTIGSRKVLSELAEQIVASKVPAVSLEYYREDMYNVMIDNKTAMREIVQHFVVDHNLRRVSFVAGPIDNVEACERMEAYREVLQENHIPLDKSLIFEGDFLKESGKAAAEYFLSLEQGLPEAVICANDVMALGVFSVFEQRGILVPDQVMLSGFDDEPAAKYHEPRLTSVTREQYKSGYMACQKLIKGIRDEDKGAASILKAQMIRRESCGCRCRDVIDNVKFRRRHFQHEEYTERFMQETREMAIELTTVESLSGLRKSLSKYVQDIGCESFYLLLCDEWEGTIHSDKYDLTDKNEEYLHTGYGDKCSLVFGYVDGKCVDKCDINLHTLLKELSAGEVCRNVFTVSPLHYRDRCFGYCIIGNSFFPFENLLFYTWIMNISNSIETIREQHLLRTMIEKLDSMWIYDNLTGLYNRAGFKKYGGYIWQECIQKKESAMILFLDADGLKCVNDTYGHDEGDCFIKIISGILTSCKHHGEAIMRYGGDEFVVLASDVTMEDAQKYKQRIQTEMDRYNETYKLPYQISASIGVIVINPEDNSKLDEAIEEADRRMYEVKKEKKSHRK